jgi:hypothetical protein
VVVTWSPRLGCRDELTRKLQLSYKKSELRRTVPKAMDDFIVNNEMKLFFLWNETFQCCSQEEQNCTPLSAEIRQLSTQ